MTIKFLLIFFLTLSFYYFYFFRNKYFWNFLPSMRVKEILQFERFAKKERKKKEKRKEEKKKIEKKKSYPFLNNTTGC